MIEEIRDKDTWNRFITSCSPNTFLHSWEWGQVQQAMGEGVRYLGWYSPAGKLSGAALVITVNARRGRHYLIPHGPLFLNLDPSPFQGEGSGLSAGQAGVRYFPADQQKREIETCLPELIAYLKSTAAHDGAVALRIAPLLETSPAALQLFGRHGFRPAPLHIHAELTWVLDITSTEDQLLANMRKTTRSAIRKAEQAGVTCAIVKDPKEVLRRFWPLYEATRQRHGFVLWPKKMVQTQLEIMSAHENIFSVIARHNNQDVAAAILPHFADTVFYYHGASKKLPSAVPAAQLLQWTAIREAKRRGANHYNFWGIAPIDQPDHPFAGITTFKKGFGGYAVDYLRAQDLPLSWRYWQLWAVDTYRKHRRGF